MICVSLPMRRNKRTGEGPKVVHLFSVKGEFYKKNFNKKRPFFMLVYKTKRVFFVIFYLNFFI